VGPKVTLFYQTFEKEPFEKRFIKTGPLKMGQTINPFEGWFVGIKAPRKHSLFEYKTFRPQKSGGI
jgi:hypothetical protein